MWNRECRCLHTAGLSHTIAHDAISDTQPNPCPNAVANTIAHTIAYHPCADSYTDLS